MDIEQSQVSAFLDLTDQQFDILMIVYYLQDNEEYITPKTILGEYYSRFKKTIQKQNLFKLLRVLLNRGFIHKISRGRYSIHVEGVQDYIEQKREDYIKNYEDFNHASILISDYFQKVNQKYEHHQVDYLSYDDFFSIVTRKLKYSSNYYITAKFPGIAYTDKPYATIGRSDYLSVLSKRSLVDKKLTVNYLTNLDPEYPFNHSKNIHKTKKDAITESIKIFDNLEEILKKYENVNIYYLDNPYVLDIILPETKNSNNTFMFIRDSKENVINGIHIQSKGIKTRSKETFQMLCKQGINLKSPKGKKIIKSKRKELIDRFS